MPSAQEQVVCPLPRLSPGWGSWYWSPAMATRGGEGQISLLYRQSPTPCTSPTQLLRNVTLPHLFLD